jgi:hypothetical protein
VRAVNTVVGGEDVLHKRRSGWRKMRDNVRDTSLTSHDLGALEAIKVPQSNGHVGRARREQGPFGVERNVLHGVGMPLERSLHVAALVVPDLSRWQA